MAEDYWHAGRRFLVSLLLLLSVFASAQRTPTSSSGERTSAREIQNQKRYFNNVQFFFFFWSFRRFLRMRPNVRKQRRPTEWNVPGPDDRQLRQRVQSVRVHVRGGFTSKSLRIVHIVQPPKHAPGVSGRFNNAKEKIKINVSGILSNDSVSLDQVVSRVYFPGDLPFTYTDEGTQQRSKYILYTNVNSVKCMRSRVYIIWHI